MVLNEHPEWLGEMTDFAAAAAEYHLVSSQALDNAAKSSISTSG
ncbi:MAG: hypothetical protein ABS876_04815 [Ruminococcus sp.]